MLCFQDIHDWTILLEFLIQICWTWTGQPNILRQYEPSINVFRARITKQRSKRASCCWDIWKLQWCQHVRGEESLVQNSKVWFTRLNISGLYRHLDMSSRSGNTKLDSKGVSCCWENWELLWNATGWEEASVSTVNLGFLGNRRPLSSPVSCFRIDSTCLNAYKGQRYSAARIAPCDFELDSPLLSRSLLCHVGITVIFKYLS